MPMKPGKSPETISSNIEEYHKGPSYAKIKRRHGAAVANKVAAAAAYATARKSGGHKFVGNPMETGGGQKATGRKFPVTGGPPQEIAGCYGKSDGSCPREMAGPANGTFKDMNVDHIEGMFPSSGKHRFVGNDMSMRPPVGMNAGTSTPPPPTSPKSG